MTRAAVMGRTAAKTAASAKRGAAAKKGGGAPKPSSNVDRRRAESSAPDAADAEVSRPRRVNQSLVGAMKKHINDPDEFVYSTEMDAAKDPEALSSWSDLLLDVREVLYPNTTVAQAEMVLAMVEILEAHADKWNLGVHAKSWPGQASQMLRVMLRHVSQAVLYWRSGGERIHPRITKRHVRTERVVCSGVLLLGAACQGERCGR